MSEAETELRRKDLDPDPFKQFAKWYESAEAAHPKLPNSMTLATATRDGRPSARTVLLKGFDEDGFVFYTNYDSQKGRELEENPQAALVFYWAAIDMQVRIEGSVTKTTREESEEYFKTRPLLSRLSAWASKQSSVVESRKVLEDEMSHAAMRFDYGEVPLPPYWGGYRLRPSVIEFWQNRSGRLHDRFRYTRQSDGRWLIERLSP
ncbi:MAG TPA: pyridoxamine 5'-phosphate oxidase [Blastocatellia bacterium]|nr:pyridoxamine 5'-phosphate oxidase [Blastocatellia bacterium]